MDEEAAAELVHESLVRIYDSLGSHNPAKGDLRGWIWGVLRHSNVRRRDRPQAAMDPPRDSPLGNIIGAEVNAFLQAARFASFHSDTSTLPSAHNRLLRFASEETDAGRCAWSRVQGALDLYRTLSLIHI